ncbi:hypothetical protein BCR44DRAFT_1104258 [Catenaria anguillulae PL171]|uniref:Uncharacterized protein n=1 Tax=Catenaria anguillulae PL171 TaxID=765915 RepID=A0A1Y2I2F9_9FUNG|nr:hypothetical protein BCR44DRAFT_1104258 [Catenaria anguillulae PL171]
MSGPASSSAAKDVPPVAAAGNASQAPPLPVLPNVLLGSDDSLSALANSTAAEISSAASPRGNGSLGNNNAKLSPTFNQTVTLAQSRSDSRSSESSAEDLHLLTKPEDRMTHLMRKKVERTSIHIISFLRLHIRLPASFAPAGSPPITFAVTVDASRTIEYLAALIEAEYAFRYTHLQSNVACHRLRLAGTSRVCKHQPQRVQVGASTASVVQ